MSQIIRVQFQKFIQTHQTTPIQQNQQITSTKINKILQTILSNNLEQLSPFNNDYFKQILNQISSFLMNTVYRHKQTYTNIEHIVSFVSILQYLFHNQQIEIPFEVKNKAEKCIWSMLYLQNLMKIKMIYADSHSSSTIQYFYKNIYLSSYQVRYRKLANQFGVNQKRPYFCIEILREIVEKSEYNLEEYESYATSQWISLSLIYYILSAKCESSRQIPILGRILEKYQQLRQNDYCHRQICGDELCNFYNTIVLVLLRRMQQQQLNRTLQEITIDLKIAGSLIISPIQNENNTILDNINFSSSCQP